MNDMDFVLKLLNQFIPSSVGPFSEEDLHHLYLWSNWIKKPHAAIGKTRSGHERIGDKNYLINKVLLKLKFYQMYLAFLESGEVGDYFNEKAQERLDGDLKKVISKIHNKPEPKATEWEDEGYKIIDLNGSTLLDPHVASNIDRINQEIKEQLAIYDAIEFRLRITGRD